MVRMMMRFYSLAFHVFLGLVMFAVGFVAWASDQHTLQIGFLPWKGPTLTYCLLGFGALSLALAVLAFKRVLPILLAVWSLAVVVMLFRGYFLSAYNFGLSGFQTAVIFTLAALLALVGSALQLRTGRWGGRRHSALA